MKQTSDHFVPRIYYFHPLLAGEPSSWRRHLNRCKDMGFDHVLPLRYLRLVKMGTFFSPPITDRAHPAVSSATADAIVEDFAKSCRACGLSLFLDIVVGEVARDALLARSSPSWFRHIGLSPALVDPDKLASPRTLHIRVSTTLAPPVTS